MSSKSVIVFIIFVVNAFLGMAQTEINYSPKALEKVLQKQGLTDFKAIKELTVPNNQVLTTGINGKYFLITENNKIAYIYIGRVNSCRGGGCKAQPVFMENRESEYFDYFILFNKDKTVLEIKVFNYQATHGHEITAKGWLKQFVGYNGTKQLKVDKNIDAISGATISVYAITADVENKTALLKEVMQ
ncbi:FMN-binding protein [uncultured Draconibacterium sp.]|uniref:FMN-binding protein n=1 Tax=uncultured Draconibacterium sp. TaxID=1573823 RepID=UPI0025EBC267|nr:FMN-binding protein [uncultured Draconibacterium sp.]